MTSSLTGLIQRSLRDNWERPALSDFNGTTLTYGEVARRIAKMHILFKAAGIRPGDKVALCAKNSAAWASAFLGTLTYGAVVVPILHEFHPDNIEHLVTHSEAKVLFSEKGILDNLDEERMPLLEAVILLPDFTLAMSRNEKITMTMDHSGDVFSSIYPDGITPDSTNYHQDAPADLALINYTSGSTGNSKGVMLTYANLMGNIEFALSQIDFLYPGDGMLSMLPLAHMYGLVFEFLFPFCRGCHITFLGRVPSPKIVMQAFTQVRPKLVITVPLVIEKIVKGKVFPTLQKPLLRTLLAIPGIRTLIFRKIRRQLISAFGGQLRQLILGGAALNAEVESFLRRIKFPFTIGYGMTECAPLVTYEWWATQRPHSCGRLVAGMEAKVDSPDPVNVAGVLHVRGKNVMQGYFKNGQATAEALSPDGWLNTGDICTIDKEGYVYLRGRDKNMILSSSGQNIYPEEIEAQINDFPLAAESVVVDRNGKIVAIVHPDYDEGRRLGLPDEEVDRRVTAILPDLNKRLPAYSHVNVIEIHHDEFEKTPKHSIRRFLYK